MHKLKAVNFFILVRRLFLTVGVRGHLAEFLCLVEPWATGLPDPPRGIGRDPTHRGPPAQRNTVRQETRRKADGVFLRGFPRPAGSQVGD